METHFYVESETQSRKAQRLLQRYRYRYRVQRGISKAGCSELFTVYAAPNEVFSLLREAQIPYQLS